MRMLIDANVAIRYLVADNEELTAKAEAIIASRPYLLTEVLCEMVYVLEGVYNATRSELQDSLTKFLDLVECDNPTLLRETLALYADHTRLDFVDCILLARHRLDGDSVATFDKPLSAKLQPRS